MNRFPLIFVTCLVFILSILISPYYVNGDQEHYINIYYKIQNLSLIQAFINYKLVLGANEVVHFFLIWIFGKIGLSKVFFVSFFNGLLAYVSFRLLRKWQASLLIASCIVLTNFYFYVLYFTAERLKFGVIFLAFSLLFLNRSKIFSFLAILGHFQVIIVYVSIFSLKVYKQLYSILIRKKVSLEFLLTILLFIFIIPFISSPIIGKFQSYYHGIIFEDLIKTFIFLFLSIIYSKNKQETFFIFIPILIAVSLVGGERINIFAYFLFLYYALPIKNGMNLGVIITGLYYFFKGLIFIYNIIEKGNGY